MGAVFGKGTTSDVPEGDATRVTNAKKNNQNPPSDSNNGSNSPVADKIITNASGCSDLDMFIAKLDAMVVEGNSVVDDLKEVIKGGELNEDFQELINQASDVETHKTFGQEAKAVFSAIFAFIKQLGEKADEEIESELSQYQQELSGLQQKATQDEQALKSQTLSLVEQRKTAARLMYINNVILNGFINLAASVKTELNWSKESDEAIVEIAEATLNATIRVLSVLTGVPIPININYNAEEEIENYIDHEIESEKPQLLNFGATVFAQCRKHIELVESVVLIQKAAQEKQAEPDVKNQQAATIAAKEALYQQSQTKVSLTRIAGSPMLSRKPKEPVLDKEQVQQRSLRTSA